MIHDIAPLFPSLDVPRMWPCQAQGVGSGAQGCGATPASVWHRSCAHGHGGDVWLCGTHAGLIISGSGACRDCSDKGVYARAVLAPADLLLLAHAGVVAKPHRPG